VSQVHGINIARQPAVDKREIRVLSAFCALAGIYATFGFSRGFRNHTKQRGNKKAPPDLSSRAILTFVQKPCYHARKSVFRYLFPPT
jgi:hypothetical protein